MYLLDADSIITSANVFYRMARFSKLWDWLAEQGVAGNIKVAQEQYDEVCVVQGPEVDWLKDRTIRDALLLDQEVDPRHVQKVISTGYGQLNDAEIEAIRGDPFLVAHAYQWNTSCTVVSYENSAPSKIGKNRKVPDVCSAMNIDCVRMYDLIDRLGYSDA